MFFGEGDHGIHKSLICCTRMMGSGKINIYLKMFGDCIHVVHLSVCFVIMVFDTCIHILNLNIKYVSVLLMAMMRKVLWNQMRKLP